MSTPRGYTIGALGCLQVPRGTNWGPMGYEKISYVHIVFKKCINIAARPINVPIFTVFPSWELPRALCPQAQQPRCSPEAKITYGHLDIHQRKPLAKKF